MPEGLVLNGLSLNNGTTHILTELQLPIPAKKPEWVEGADADGAVLMRDPLVENGTLVAKLDLYTANKDAANTAIGAIVDQLEEADRNPTGIPVVWTPVNGTKSLTFYALSGEITELPMDTKTVDSNVPTIQITLKCRPGGYGALVTGPSATDTEPVVTLTIPNVPGDMPTDEAYIVITDTAAQTRRHVEWGAEWLHYQAGANVLLDSDNVTISGGAFSGSIVTMSGAYSPASGTLNAVQGIAFTTPSALLGTGSRTHIGTFRVKARVYVDPPTGTDYNVMFRFTWRVGDGEYTTNDWAVPPAANADFYFSEVDLGLVTIPPADAGTQAWDGRLEIASTTAAASGQVNALFDYFLFIPVEAGYGRARGAVTSQPGVIAAYDLFNQSAGNLHGKSLGGGGTWATSGAATDFQTNGAGVGLLTRTAGGDTAGAGRFAIAGTVNFADVDASVRMWNFNLGSYTQHYSGLVLRYVDANNWFGVFTDTGNLPGSRILKVYKTIGGTRSQIAYAGASNWASLGNSPDGIHLDLSAHVSGSGAWAATVIVSNASLGGTFTLTGSDAVLATGGTLATGKPGLYSERTGTSVQITFDDFMVSSIPALTPAIYPSRTLEVTGSNVRRQNSAGTVYGPVAFYRGSRFQLNPAGSANRTTRVVAKAHRADPDAGGRATFGDSLKVQVFYRPRFSVVPR